MARKLAERVDETSPAITITTLCIRGRRLLPLADRNTAAAAAAFMIDTRALFAGARGALRSSRDRLSLSLSTLHLNNWPNINYSIAVPIVTLARLVFESA